MQPPPAPAEARPPQRTPTQAALADGAAGAAAVSGQLQVLALNWLRTVVTHQHVHGGRLWPTVRARIARRLVD